MAMDAREEGRAGSGTAEDIDRHHFSFPCSATTMPKPISFRDRPEYSQSYRKVRRSFEMTLLPTMVCRLPVTSERRFFVSRSIFSKIGRASCREGVCQYV